MRTPKVYVRGSGVLHALLGIADKETLLSHPVVGASWETWVIVWVVYPGVERYRLGDDAWAVSLQELTQGLRTLQA